MNTLMNTYSRGEEPRRTLETTPVARKKTVGFYVKLDVRDDGTHYIPEQEIHGPLPDPPGTITDAKVKWEACGQSSMADPLGRIGYIAIKYEIDAAIGEE